MGKGTMLVVDMYSSPRFPSIFVVFRVTYLVSSEWRAHDDDGSSGRDDFIRWKRDLARWTHRSLNRNEEINKDRRVNNSNETVQAMHKHNRDRLQPFYRKRGDINRRAWKQDSQTPRRFWVSRMWYQRFKSTSSSAGACFRPHKRVWLPTSQNWRKGHAYRYLPHQGCKSA